jgi:hypothetical protein
MIFPIYSKLFCFMNRREANRRRRHRDDREQRDRDNLNRESSSDAGYSTHGRTRARQVILILIAFQNITKLNLFHYSDNEDDTDYEKPIS